MVCRAEGGITGISKCLNPKRYYALVIKFQIIIEGDNPLKKRIDSIPIGRTAFTKIQKLSVKGVWQAFLEQCEQYLAFIG